MSSLTENLQQIYSIKQEIKEVIGTNSDLFEDYPDLIEDKLNEAIDWDDVATAGYIVPAGTLNIAENGSSIDVASYAYAYVAVPQSGITPTGNYSYTIPLGETQLHLDVTSYAYAYIYNPYGRDYNDSLTIAGDIVNGR